MLPSTSCSAVQHSLFIVALCRWGFTEDRDRWSRSDRAEGNRIGTSSDPGAGTLDGSALKEASYLGGTVASQGARRGSNPPRSPRGSQGASRRGQGDSAARPGTNGGTEGNKSRNGGGGRRGSAQRGEGNYDCPEPDCPSHRQDPNQLGQVPGSEAKIHGGSFARRGSRPTSPGRASSMGTRAGRQSNSDASQPTSNGARASAAASVSSASPPRSCSSWFGLGLG